MYYDFITPDDAPPIILNIWDKDEELFKTDDDFLGRAIIFLKDAQYSDNNDIPDPTWHKVYMGFNKEEAHIGEILCSFSIVPDDY